MKNMTKGRKKVKGVVLFTVVAVMAVMLIFLLATLSVVMAVQRRTTSDYSSSQSYYTARSAVDTVLQALSNPADASLADEIFDWKTPGEIKPITLTGLPASMGQITALNIECTGSVWDVPVAIPERPTAQDERTIYKLSATARVGDEETTVSAYVSWNIITHTSGSIVTATGASKSSTLCTTGATGVGTNAPIYGSSALSMEAPTDLELTNASQISGSITAYGNVETGTSSAIYTLGTGNGFIVYGNDKPGFGNLTVLNTTGIYGNTNIMMDGATTYGNPAMSSTMTVVTEAQLKNIKAYKLQDGIDLIPFLYCDKVFKPGDSGSKIGYTGTDICAPVNIYCGSIDTTGYNNEISAGIVGDVFCYDNTATSVFKRTNTTNIIGWAASQLGLTGDTTIISGNLYTKGNLNFTGGNWVIQGNLYCQGSISQNGGTLTVTGKCNKAGFGTQDSALKFPDEMDTYTESGKTYPGVVYHKTANPTGFIMSYADKLADCGTAALASTTQSIVSSAAAGVATMQEYVGGDITTSVKLSQTKLTGDIIVDLTTLPEGTPANNVVLYFPNGCTMDGKNMTVKNLVNWQFKTDSDGYILDSSGSKITDILDAATAPVAASDGLNGKLPVQTASLDGGFFKVAPAVCQIVLGKDKNFRMENGERILSEYYSSQLNTALHLYEDGSLHPESVPCIDLQMDGGEFFMQNNAIVSAYAYAVKADFETNTSGSQLFSGTVHTTINNSTVVINNDKAKYILWIGGLSFGSCKTQNDSGMVMIAKPAKATITQVTPGQWIRDYASLATNTRLRWYALAYVNE